MINFPDFNIRLRKHLPGIRLPRHSCNRADELYLVRTVIVRAESRSISISCEAGSSGCAITTSRTAGKIELDAMSEVLARFIVDVPNGVKLDVTVRDTVYSEVSTVIPRESL